MASDRVLPVHFGLLSLVLFIRGASFVCPALAFELRVLDLAFLVSRPPALHNQYTADTVRTERGLSLPGRITVFQCNSIPGYFSTGTRDQANSNSSHRGRSHWQSIDNIPPSQGYEHCHRQESTTQYYRLLPLPAIPELSQVWPDLVSRFILVFVLPSLFPIPVAAAAAPPLEPGTTVLGTDTYKALT